jgi:hypothetical protein
MDANRVIGDLCTILNPPDGTFVIKFGASGFVWGFPIDESGDVNQ